VSLLSFCSSNVLKTQETRCSTSIADHKIWTIWEVFLWVNFTAKKDSPHENSTQDVFSSDFFQGGEFLQVSWLPLQPNAKRQILILPKFASDESPREVTNVGFSHQHGGGWNLMFL